MIPGYRQVWRSIVSIIAILLLLAACSSPSLISEEAALFSDEDIKQAELELAVEVLELLDLELEVDEPPEEIEEVESADLETLEGELSSQGVLSSVGGYVAYVRHNPNNSNPWQLWRANQANDVRTKVYEGKQEIQSAAVSLDGNTLLLAMRRTETSQDFEIYRLNLSSQTPTRLTSTSTPESNVSMSVDGSTLVWEGTNSSGKRAVFIRDYSGASFSERILSASDHHIEPSVSGNGNHVAFVRKLSDGRDRIRLYNKTSANYQTVFTSTSKLSHPSPSNGGGKVAWLQGTSQVRVKNMSNNTTSTAVSNEGSINHPHLTADGNFLSYARLVSGSWRIFTRNLSTKTTAQTVGGSSPVNNYAPFWQMAAVERPKVMGTRPADGATGVPLNEFVSTDLYLPNGGFHEKTLTGDTVRLLRVSDNQQVPAYLNYSGGRDTFTLQPVELLEANTQYRFEVTEGLKDETGVPFLPFSSTFTTGSQGGTGTGDIAFEKVALPTSEGVHYTSLAIGPDNKLYATTVDGEIKRFAILSNGTLGQMETLRSLVVKEGGPRLLIGLAFDPAATAGNLIAWVTHTVLHDRQSSVKPDDWTGKITRLSGANLGTIQDYVIGLPRSTIDHATNIPAFGPDGALYVPQGSNTSKGAPDSAWGNRPERLLSAAILRVDVRAIAQGTRPLNVKTAEGGGTYDPFASAAPVTVYASGVRNAYHLVWHSNGQLYVPTNGANRGGSTPGTPSPLPTSCGRRIDAGIHGSYTGPQVPGLSGVQQTMPDFLFRVDKGGYYGHPNPQRCEWVLNGGNPTSSADSAQVDDYPVGTKPDRNWRGFAHQFNLNASSNGIVEYKNGAFGGRLRGKLLVVRFNKYNDIIVLTPGSASQNYRIVNTQVGIEGFTGFLTPLALVENPSNGHVYVAEFNRAASGLSLDELVISSLEPMQTAQPKITLLRPK